MKKMKNDQMYLIKTNNKYSIRTETHNGRKHIVVPVVMMVEGVHSGSHGPLLHTIDELGKYAAAWNGIPVTIDHPERDGNFVSANSPDIVENAVGRVFNTHVDGEKLKAEAWLDAEKLKAVSPEALAYIRNNRPLDVSVGVFSDEEGVEGEWNGESYIAIARNHRPDHLALLPGGVGACSWADGCGVRANVEHKEKGGIDVKVNELLKKVHAAGFSVNEIGNVELAQKIRQKLDAMDTDTTMYFLEEVYDDYFIYSKRTHEGGNYFRRGYELQDDESVEFSDEPEEVRKKVEFVAMEKSDDGLGVKRTKFTNNSKNDDVMKDKDEKKKAPTCKVDALIKNEMSKFTEEDREFLLEQDEETIDKMVPVEPAPQSNKEEEKEVDKEKALEVLKEKISDTKEFMELLPDELKAQMEYGLKLYKAERQKLIDSIISNSPKDNWTKEELQRMDMEVLRKISKSVQKVDYSAQGGEEIQDNSETEEEVLLPAGVEAKKNDNK